MSTSFATWLTAFVEEKDLDLCHLFQVETTQYTHLIPLHKVLDAARFARPDEQDKIKDILVQLDFRNGDVMHFFNHLAGGVARAWEQESA